MKHDVDRLTTYVRKIIESSSPVLAKCNTDNRTYW